MKRALLVLFVGLAAAGGLAPIAVARETVLPAPRVITGVGYAPISSQPATTDEERRLLAIRASQLAAMRNLAEQIHGLRVESSSRAAGSTIQRSEEHTSELQSLMRTSYAVFCLKKKNNESTRAKNTIDNPHKL